MGFFLFCRGTIFLESPKFVIISNLFLKFIFCGKFLGGFFWWAWPSRIMLGIFYHWCRFHVFDSILYLNIFKGLLFDFFLLPFKGFCCLIWSKFIEKFGLKFVGFFVTLFRRFLFHFLFSCSNSWGCSAMWVSPTFFRTFWVWSNTTLFFFCLARNGQASFILLALLLIIISWKNWIICHRFFFTSLDGWFFFAFLLLL